MGQPLISIIVPVFNTAPFLEQCLSSIVQQTYVHWEALLIDDASTDGLSLSICNEWGRRDERFRVIPLPKNGGLSYVRNEGLALAQGHLVTFLDSDDFLAANHLASLFEVFEQSGCDIATTGFLQCTAEGKVKKRLYPSVRKGYKWKRKEALKALLMDRKLTSHSCNKLFQKRLFDGLAFPVGQVYEDFSIMLPLVERSNGVVHTGENTYYYRRHGASITKVTTPKHLQDFFTANEGRYYYLLQDNEFISSKERALLLLWYRKTLLRVHHETQGLPPSPERDKVLVNISSSLKKMGIKEIKCCYGLRMLGYSLRKRYYECLLK
ncbi:glycosyltransferase family 2 protein [Porphyromonas circumdentaria]|uniref:Glycosyltransferase involved in cell wall bisynthesis n=1 Tax=Porphyromonas circumdentaria TaxID=29524 RepID=A0A1T4NLI5_9PORP|nr:glycosyltransferase family 2 protein [Porphyromonas circumdentaria]MBB6276119.1 glycosyltransferase involved in cell wall biosynthesis [Porphyromonas circumdentaria]SJZ79937.1 Glycosyltransferase involved in cell wall bisynthesis [Porphyromonas circumdentaria]